MATYKEYFTLVARESHDQPWAIEFGDYERGPVQFEMQDYRDKGYKRTNLLIITTDHTSEAIAKRVAELNANAGRS